MKSNRAVAGILLFSCFCGSAFADPWQEREALTRVREQLIRIQKLLDQAQHASEGNRGRLRMEYPSIRNDLQTIEQGIYQYLNTPMEPADIAPLDGGYTDYQRAGKKQLPVDPEEVLRNVQP